MTKQVYTHHTPDSRSSKVVDTEARKEYSSLPTEEEVESIYESFHKEKAKAIRDEQSADEKLALMKDLERKNQEFHHAEKVKKEREEKEQKELELKNAKKEAYKGISLEEEGITPTTKRWNYNYTENKALPNPYTSLGRTFVAIMDKGDEGMDIDEITGEAYLSDEDKSKSLGRKERLQKMKTAREKAVSEGKINTFDKDTKFGNSEFRLRQLNGNPREQSQRSNLVIKEGNRLYINKKHPRYQEIKQYRKDLEELEKQGD